MSSPYLLQENDEYSFEFDTDHALKYVIYFIDYSSQFAAYPILAGRVFMFNIDVISGDPSTVPGDERIAVTIFHVFRLFFTKEQNVAVYVCDNLDQRHMARRRKFDHWFHKYNDGNLIKSDNLALVDGVQILNSILLHVNNTSRKDILSAYEDLNRSVEVDK